MAIQILGSFPDHIVEAISFVHKRYTGLHDDTIIVERTRISGSTMQAQPVLQLSTVFQGFNTYRLSIAEYVRDSDTIKVDHLSYDVIVGWFAHEFGHIVDYTSRSVLEMALYGVRYVMSANYARRVEAEADRIAVRHGFYKYVRQTKMYLMEGEVISSKYRAKLEKTYMSLEDLEVCNIDWEGRLPS